MHVRHRLIFFWAPCSIVSNPPALGLPNRNPHKYMRRTKADGGCSPPITILWIPCLSGKIQGIFVVFMGDKMIKHAESAHSICKTRYADKKSKKITGSLGGMNSLPN